MTNEERPYAEWGRCELCEEPIALANEMLWLVRGEKQMLIHRKHAAEILAEPVDEGVNVVTI